MSIGDSLCSFKPFDAELPVSAYATLGLINNRPVINFPAAQNTTAIFTGFMPRIYTGQNLTVNIQFAMASATTGSVNWNASFENTGIQQKSIDADDFAVTNSSNNNTVATTLGNVVQASINFTAGAATDNINIGDTFRIRISRSSSDTALGNAEVVMVEIEET